MNIILASALILAMSASTMPASHAQEPEQQQRLIETGYVLDLPISEFAPAGTQKPYDLIAGGQYGAAIPLLKTEVSRHENDLAAYTCLVQADPEFRDAQIRQGETDIRQSRLGAVALFKLGAAHYYRAWLVYVTDSNIAADPELTRAKELLKRAWQRSKLPMIGTVYANASQMPGPNLLLEGVVLDQLIDKLAGPEAYSSYVHASELNWQTSPPLIGQVLPANLKPLRGVVRLAKSFSSTQVGHGVMQGNNIVAVSDPLTPEQQRKTAYLGKWRELIDQAMQANHIS